LVSVSRGLIVLMAVALMPGVGRAGQPKPVPAQIIEQWSNAGAEVGWIHVTEHGFLQFRAEPQGNAVYMRAFRFGAWKQGVAANLSDAGSPFGLYLGATQVSDLGLKELAALRNLQVLSLHQTPVTDAGMKELAGLKNLRLLELSGTQVTDVGVKELQRALPNCRIIR
jgi:hypothetical protein